MLTRAFSPVLSLGFRGSLVGVAFASSPVKPGLAHVLMTSWALDFESRDYRFLAHKSGILPTLQAMVTLTNTASLASSSLDSLNDTSRGPQKDTRGSKTSTGLQSWTPWSLETVRGGFMQVRCDEGMENESYYLRNRSCRLYGSAGVIERGWSRDG